MKKIFRKSNIFSFLLGAIIFGGIGTVVAATILAKDVSYTPKDTSWKVDNVKDAIDDLYSKAKPEYTGITTVTPTTSNQVIATGNKILTSDITINAIPSTYKNLTQNTTVNSNNLLSGVKAYNSDGELVTGNISTDCVRGSYTKPANTYININLGFTPTMYLVNFTVSSGGKHNINYNSNYSANSYDYILDTNGNVGNPPQIDSLTISNNKIVDNSGTTTARYSNSFTVYYMACK